MFLAPDAMSEMSDDGTLLEGLLYLGNSSRSLHLAISEMGSPPARTERTFSDSSLHSSRSFRRTPSAHYATGAVLSLSRNRGCAEFSLSVLLLLRASRASAGSPSVPPPDPRALLPVAAVRRLGCRQTGRHPVFVCA
jgi:hypothetical protein